MLLLMNPSHSSYPPFTTDLCSESMFVMSTNLCKNMDHLAVFNNNNKNVIILLTIPGIVKITDKVIYEPHLAKREKKYQFVFYRYNSVKKEFNFTACTHPHTYTHTHIHTCDLGTLHVCLSKTGITTGKPRLFSSSVYHKRKPWETH